MEHDDVIAHPWQWVMLLIFAKYSVADVLVGDISKGHLSNDFTREVDEVYASSAPSVRKALVLNFMSVMLAAVNLDSCDDFFAPVATQLLQLAVRTAECTLESAKGMLIAKEAGLGEKEAFLLKKRFKRAGVPRSVAKKAKAKRKK